MTHSYRWSKLAAPLVAAAGLLACGIAAGAATLPALPQVYVDTTYAAPAGKVIAVAAGGSLQAALDSALPGDTITLQAGATYTGPFTLPNKGGASWIHVRSSAYGNLPAPGMRVGPADAGNMPKIVVAPNAGAAIVTAPGAHHFRFIGIEIKPAPGTFVYTLVSLGNGEASTASQPHHIVLDRCYVHGDPSRGGRRGIALDGSHVAVVDSHVSDFKEPGNDSQAVWGYNGQGPIRIVNNHLEASGENVMFGGADPVIANLVPSDIEIRRNHIVKPLSWMGGSWSVKNLIELKNAQRVLIEGNLIENNWPSSQNGFGILVTPRNQDGRAPWSVVQDVTFRLNYAVNLAQGFNISGRDAGGAGPSQVTRRVLIENNVIQVTSLGGATGTIFQVTNGPSDLTIQHNTAFTNGSQFAFTESTPKADRFVFQNNIVSYGNYGFLGTGSGDGVVSLNMWYTNYTLTANALVAATSGAAARYPAGNFFPASLSAVGFANLGSADYRLAATSLYNNAGTDGRDLGADLDAIGAAMGSLSVKPAPPSNLTAQ